MTVFSNRHYCYHFWDPFAQNFQHFSSSVDFLGGCLHSISFIHHDQQTLPWTSIFSTASSTAYRGQSADTATSSQPSDPIWSRTFLLYPLNLLLIPSGCTRKHLKNHLCLFVMNTKVQKPNTKDWLLTFQNSQLLSLMNIFSLQLNTHEKEQLRKTFLIQGASWAATVY